MKIGIALLAILVAVNVGAAEQQQPNQPKKVPVKIGQTYIPGGFDSNDPTQLVVEGYFPNSCYRIDGYTKEVDAATQKVTITQSALKYKGQCLMMLVPFWQTVKVGLLKANDYKVVDGSSGEEVGVMPVRVASSAEPDDFTYATVKDAYVGLVDGGKRSIIIEGELPGDCYFIKEKRVVLDSKNVIAVLPIIEKQAGRRCNSYRLPFMTTAELPDAPAGRYLLHVRSLSGNAINKLVDL
jgi:hypothetical protein